MKYLGAHVSAAGGVDNAPYNAHEIGADAFALFTKNQKKWFEKPLDKEIVLSFAEMCRKYGYTPDKILPHGSYLVNIGSPEEDKLQISRNSLIEEVRRCEALNLKYLNIHLGAHKKMITEDECLQVCAETINICHQQTENLSIIIENSSGQGTRTGYKFEHLKQVIDLVEDKERIGVCLDTCHAFGSGYDLGSYDACESTFTEFDNVIGFKWLKGMHLNDSMIELGSRKDRHAPIGKGLIGLECFEFIMQDKRFNGIPLILETPESDNWKEEIKLLRQMIKE